MQQIFRRLAERQWCFHRFLSVGLDCDLAKIPEPYRTGHLSQNLRVSTFAKDVINATRSVAGFYKPNIAFYAELGDDGPSVLRGIIEHVKDHDDSRPVILDYKRADIGATNRGYLKEALYYGADAVTVNPYFGEEALKPLFDSDLGIIVLCKTSNPGSGEFQDRMVLPHREEAEQWGIPLVPMPLYELVAYRVSRSWEMRHKCALVVGATYPEQLGRVREIVGDMPILVPGVGTQGGDLAAVMRNGLDENGTGLMINSSSGIVFAENPAAAAVDLHVQINNLQMQVMRERRR